MIHDFGMIVDIHFISIIDSSPISRVSSRTCSRGLGPKGGGEQNVRSGSSQVMRSVVAAVIGGNNAPLRDTQVADTPKMEFSII